MIPFPSTTKPYPTHESGVHGAYVDAVRSLSDVALSREIARMALILLTEPDEYDVNKARLAACHEAAEGRPGLFRASLAAVYAFGAAS